MSNCKAKLLFEEAEGILWKLTAQTDGAYKLITSEYWIGKEDIINGEFDATVLIAEDDDETE